MPSTVSINVKGLEAIERFILKYGSSELIKHHTINGALTPSALAVYASQAEAVWKDDNPHFILPEADSNDRQPHTYWFRDHEYEIELDDEDNFDTEDEDLSSDAPEIDSPDDDFRDALRSAIVASIDLETGDKEEE